jgi:DNA (cytosine-5)-methyltransferase 1
MKFGSVCSGIEAASVAWEPLGWKAAWFSEIEPFPSAVLKHHYPDTPNLGDMTALPDRIKSGEVQAPDLFCGGTPCQAFSVAGLRKSLDDARGNLSLTFCEIANAIDNVRRARGEPAAIVFWENVPGVLNTKDNAFGCFLAGLAGEELPLLPPGGKWTNAGCVFGSERAVAWRVLDAQHFGVAQRRRRVFVVASARDDFDPAAVLFEFDGVRRDSAPSREAGEESAARTGFSVTGSVTGGYGPKLGTDEACQGSVIPQPFSLANCLTARMYKGINSTLDEGQTPVVTHSLRGEGFDASEDGTGRGTPLVPVGFTRCDHGGDAVMDGTPTMRCGSNYSAHLAVAFHPTQDPISSTDGTTHAMGCGSKNGTATVAVAFDTYNQALNPHVTHTLRDGDGKGTPALLTAMQVRRLTPVECERLQGFPDNYTAIPWRKKTASECPDGPRYKALGNSWAVPVVRWIGNRIKTEIKCKPKK